MVIGGTIDGSNVDSTSIYMNGKTEDGDLTNFAGLAIIVGSFNKVKDNEEIAKVGKAVCNFNYVNIASITGCMGNVRIDELEYNADHCKFSWIGAGESIVDKVDAGAPGNVYTLANKQWVKNVVMNFKDSNISLFYSACNCGYTYTLNTVANMENCTVGYLISGGSNGMTDKSVVNINGGTVDVLQFVNRGTVKESGAVITGGANIKKLYPGGANEDDVNGIINKVTADVDKTCTVGLYKGKNGANIMTSEEVNEIIKYVKISRSTTVTYEDGFKDFIGNKLIIK